MMLSPAQGIVQLEYRDSIRRISVSGGLCSRSSLQFFPRARGRDTAAAGDGRYYGLSSTCSDSSFSDDSDLSFSSSSDRGAVTPDDAAHELRDIALQMVRDGYFDGLVRAFGAGGALPSALVVPPCPDELLLRSWFWVLDVDWVLRIEERADVAALQLEDGCVTLQDLMEKWIRALKTMVHVLRIAKNKQPSRSAGGVRKLIQSFLLLATGKRAGRLQQDVLQLARFAEASILRMIAFVDAVAAAASSDDQAPETLPGMLQLYTCVADDLPPVLALFKQAPGTASMFDDLHGIFLRKRKKLSDSVWGMMERVRASLLAGDCWHALPEAGGVHKTTRLMMNYIMLLRRNDGALSFILQDHHYSTFVSETEGFSSAVNLIVDAIACLEQKLVDASFSISDDPALRCLFLMNNSDFIAGKVESMLLPSWTPIAESKLQRHIETYLDASWGPVLACLHDDDPHRGLRRHSSLAPFESKLQATYAAQKQWKVPNPELRKRLRKAVMERVVLSYSSYLAARRARGKSETSRSSSLTPRELEERLEELFEG